MVQLAWHHVVHLSVRQHLANPQCTPESTKAWDPRISLWKHKERRVSVSTLTVIAATTTKQWQSTEPELKMAFHSKQLELFG